MAWICCKAILDYPVLSLDILELLRLLFRNLFEHLESDWLLHYILPCNTMGIKALISDRSQTDSFQPPFIDSNSDSYQWLEEKDTAASSPWFPLMQVPVLPGQTLLTHSFLSWP